MTNQDRICDMSIDELTFGGKSKDSRFKATLKHLGVLKLKDLYSIGIIDLSRATVNGWGRANLTPILHALDEVGFDTQRLQTGTDKYTKEQIALLYTPLSKIGIDSDLFYKQQNILTVLDLIVSRVRRGPTNYAKPEELNIKKSNDLESIGVVVNKSGNVTFDEEKIPHEKIIQEENNNKKQSDQKTL